MAQHNISPIIDKVGLLLGGVENGKWVKDKLVAARLKGGERYRFLDFSGSMKTYVGGKPRLDDISGSSYYIESEEKREGTIGVGGTGSVLPRRWRNESVTRGVYVRAVAELLGEKGMRVAHPRLTRVLRLDLDGKGEDSVLIEAQSANFEKLFRGGEQGYGYSLVLLRTMLKGRLRTFLLNGDFIKPGNNGGDLVEKFTLAPPIDLNSDGVFEIVVQSEYYEGGGAQVFALEGGIPKEVLSASAGA